MQLYIIMIRAACLSVWPIGCHLLYAVVETNKIHTSSLQSPILFLVNVVSVLLLQMDASKSCEMFNFLGCDGSVGQLDRVMQIYASTLSNEIAYVIQPGKTQGCVKKPPSVDGHM